MTASARCRSSGPCTAGRRRTQPPVGGGALTHCPGHSLHTSPLLLMCQKCSRRAPPRTHCVTPGELSLPGPGRGRRGLGSECAEPGNVSFTSLSSTAPVPRSGNVRSGHTLAAGRLSPGPLHDWGRLPFGRRQSQRQRTRRRPWKEARVSPADGLGSGAAAGLVPVAGRGRRRAWPSVRCMARAPAEHRACGGWKLLPQVPGDSRKGVSKTPRATESRAQGCRGASAPPSPLHSERGARGFSRPFISSAGTGTVTASASNFLCSGQCPACPGCFINAHQAAAGDTVGEV